MSVAFSDVAIWRDLLRDIPDLTNYRLIDESYTTFQNKRKMNHSFVVNVLAQALYELFSADDGKCRSIFCALSVQYHERQTITNFYASCKPNQLCRFSFKYFFCL